MYIHIKIIYLLDKNLNKIECIEECEKNNSNYTGTIKKDGGCFCSLKIVLIKF